MHMTPRILPIMLLGVLLSAAAPAQGSSPEEAVATSRATAIFLELPGEDQPGVALLPTASDYYFIAGAVFIPLDSTVTYEYVGGGCITASGSMKADFQLPHGATIRGFRTYYYNSGLAGGVRAGLVNYDGQGQTTNLGTQTSTGDTGYLSEYWSLATPYVVDNYASMHSISNVNIPSGMRLCGIRIFYDHP